MLHDLGQLLLRAVPTFLLVFALDFYLKYMFFKPLEKVLQQRYDATEGARKLAAEALELAAAKTAHMKPPCGRRARKSTRRRSRRTGNLPSTRPASFWRPGSAPSRSSATRSGSLPRTPKS